MLKFIKVVDAVTGNDMLLNTAIIATVEESFMSSSSGTSRVRKISFTDNRPDVFIKNYLENIANYLCNG